MEKRTIWVKPSTFAPEFEMIIPVPTDRDDVWMAHRSLKSITDMRLTWTSRKASLKLDISMG